METAMLESAGHERDRLYCTVVWYYFEVYRVVRLLGFSGIGASAPVPWYARRARTNKIQTYRTYRTTTTITANNVY